MLFHLQLRGVEGAVSCWFVPFSVYLVSHRRGVCGILGHRALLLGHNHMVLWVSGVGRDIFCSICLSLVDWVVCDLCLLYLYLWHVDGVIGDSWIVLVPCLSSDFCLYSPLFKEWSCW